MTLRSRILRWEKSWTDKDLPVLGTGSRQFSLRQSEGAAHMFIGSPSKESLCGRAPQRQSPIRNEPYKPVAASARAIDSRKAQ
jgi:hypothetical protein